MSLIASFSLTLEPLNPGAPVPDETGISTRGLLYHLLGNVNPAVAAGVHEGDGPRPFTCSSLIGRHRRADDGRALLAASPYRLRYTALNSAVADVLSEALFRAYALGEPVRIGALEFRIRRVITASEQDYWARATTYDALLEIEPRTQWRLAFRSPTAFRQQFGHLPLPLPHSIFRSALTRWNALCPAACAIEDETLARVAETVFPSAVSVRTVSVALEHGHFVGFVGRADLQAVRPLPDQHARRLTALAEYLYYCGAGHGTPRGWGQVAVIDSPPGREPEKEQSQ